MPFQSSVTRRLQLLLAASLIMFLSACSTLDQSAPPALERQASWVVLPFANNTETPLAGNRAEAIAQALLQAQGVGAVARAPVKQQDTLFGNDSGASSGDAMAWAREHQVRYALAGSVEEWRYKVGVDGEPAVGVTLHIVDVADGKTLWSGSGAQSGWSREALSGVAQKLIRKLLQSGLAGAH